jgi:hypothetical protein
MDTQPQKAGGEAPAASKTAARTYYEARARQSNRAQYYSLHTGPVLGQALRTWFRNLPALFVLAAFVHSPVIIGGFLVYTLWPDLGTNQAVSLAISGIDIVAASVLSGAVAFVVVRQLMGERASFTQSLSMGSTSLLRVIGTGTIAGVTMTVGFALLLIPGILAACTLFVAVPAALFERTGPLASFKRSSFLTKNNRLSILAAVGLIGTLSAAFGAIYHVAIGASLGYGLSYFWQPRAGEYATAFAASQVLALLSGTLGPVLASVVYVHLRQGKEGATVEALASIFD